MIDIMTLERVKVAIQRNSHLTHKQMWQLIPEFMELWSEQSHQNHLWQIKMDVATHAMTLTGRSCFIDKTGYIDGR